MLEAILDPWMLAYNADYGREDEYLERVLDIHDAIIKDALICQVSAAAALLLEDDDLYPLGKNAEQTPWVLRSDLYKVIGRILDRSPKIEDSGFMPLAIDGFSAKPGYNCLTDKHEEHFKELLASSIIRREVNSEDVPILTLAGVSKEIDVEFDLVAADHAKLSEFQGATHAGICQLALNNAELRVQVDPYKVASKSLVLCIELLLERRGGAPRKWKIGDDLDKSLSAHCLASHPARFKAFLRAVVETIVGDDARSSHAIRKSKGGAARQLAREDGALAWRADIDDEYHLHYWSLGGDLEISRVVTHNDFSI